MPKPGRRGRPREIKFREVINAVRYLVRSGCGWRMLPVHFGQWRTVHGWFRELARCFLFQTIRDIEPMLDRGRAGRAASPSAAVLDSQSVKAPQAAAREYDAAKRLVGRKRHIAADTDGRHLMVNLTPADIAGSTGAQAILDAIRHRWPWVKHLFADATDDRLGHLMCFATLRHAPPCLRPPPAAILRPACPTTCPRPARKIRGPRNGPRATPRACTPPAPRPMPICAATRTG
jgi:transposase